MVKVSEWRNPDDMPPTRPPAERRGGALHSRSVFTRALLLHGEQRGGYILAFRFHSELVSVNSLFIRFEHTPEGMHAFMRPRRRCLSIPEHT